MKVFKIILIILFLLIIAVLITSIVFFQIGFNGANDSFNTVLDDLNSAQTSFLDSLHNFGYAGIFLIADIIMSIIYLPLSFIYILLSKNKKKEISDWDD